MEAELIRGANHLRELARNTEEPTVAAAFLDLAGELELEAQRFMLGTELPEATEAIAS
jgi:hypothetical protein